MRPSALILFLILTIGASLPAFAVRDSTKVKPPEPADSRQLRFSLDLSRPILNIAKPDQYSYEFMVDYYLRRELYVAVEGGWGGSEYSYPDLSYTSSNPFIRVGIDKTLVKRLVGNDWDLVSLGARYGLGTVKRSEASYTTTDSVWGSTSGTVAAKNTTAHWAEIVAGVRVELWPRIMTGWNARVRFLLNDRAFDELSPAFIAGYGRGDKTVVFDLNFYVCYALRWKRKNEASQLPPP